MGVLVGMFFCPSRLGVSRKEYVSDTTVFGGAREDRERERGGLERALFSSSGAQKSCFFLRGGGIHRRRRRRHGRVSWEQ